MHRQQRRQIFVIHIFFWEKALVAAAAGSHRRAVHLTAGAALQEHDVAAMNLQMAARLSQEQRDTLLQ